MEKEFVTYELAVKLKELGFNEPCFAWYVSKKYGLEFGKVTKENLFDEGVLAPTFSQVFIWFEDNQQLYPSVVIDQTSYPKYAFEIASFFGNPKDLTEKDWGWNEMILSKNLYRTRLEAEIECLKKLLELIKNK